MPDSNTYSTGHLFILGFVTCSFCLFVVSLQQTPKPKEKLCPSGWSKFNSSCYFSGERFNGQTFYSAQAFCLSLKSHLVEINSLEELEYLNNAAKKIYWTDGPWVGVIKPFGDNRWILPSTRTESTDLQLNKLFEEIASKSSSDCAGFDRDGENFGFWRCRNGGSPWCEIELD